MKLFPQVVQLSVAFCFIFRYIASRFPNHAMSLYSGIKFGNGQSDPTVATSATPSSSISTRVDEPSTSASPSASPANIESSKPALAKPAGEWSTALKFAPRIPKAKPITAPPRPAGFSTTTYSAVPTVIEAKADIVRSAEPQLKVEDEVVLGPDGKPLARAPAMTLGAGGEKRGPAKGKKGAKREWARGRGPGEGAKKKKKKKVGRLLRVMQIKAERCVG